MPSFRQFAQRLRIRMLVVWMLGGLAAGASLAPPGAHGATVTTVFTFPGGTGGGVPQGQRPLGPLAAAPDGSLFGVTQGGGPTNSGTIFQLLPAAPGAATLTGRNLHDFAGDAPLGALARDSAGNLYGMAQSRLAYPSDDPGCYNNGVCTWMYQLAPPTTPDGAWSYRILHRFANFPSTFGPSMDLLALPSGAIAGVSSSGGDPACHCGFVYQVSPPKPGHSVWRYSALYNFRALPDAEDPFSGLALDAAGNLVGASAQGGGGGCAISPAGATVGCGAVYRVTPSGQETVLHGFTAAEQGKPIGRLAVGGDGTLYGVASYDVFALTPPATAGQAWTKRTLFELPLPAPGGIPYSFAIPAGVILDPAGNVFGVTQRTTAAPASAFELARPAKPAGKWRHSALAIFKANQLLSGLARGADGRLYGMVAGGAAGEGQVFAISLP